MTVLVNSIPTGAAAQTIDDSVVNSTNAPLSQIPSTPPPQDVIPPVEPTFPVTPTPETLPPPEELLQSPPPIRTIPTPTPGEAHETFTVERFNVIGSTVFSPEELNRVLAPFTNRPLTFTELFQARSAIAQLYLDNDYITSGALIPPQTIRGGVVTLQVVEGKLEAINIIGTRRLDPNYVRSRLSPKKPINEKRLRADLQLLKLNPLIKDISAALKLGTSPQTSVLEVNVTEAKTFNTQLVADNGRTPSVGSFRRRLQLSEANLLGLGDGLSLGYNNSDGSNGFDASYVLPVNSRNGTVSLSYGTVSSDVIEPPFNALDINGNSRYYDITLRQPLSQTPSEEFALGLSATRSESEISSSVLEDFGLPPSELSPGADDQGRTRISAIQFFQDWTKRSSREVIAARSGFNLGIGAFNATVNEDAPDSRFFSWRGQAQWVRLLAPETLLVLRGDVQLSPDALVPSQQFSLGGIDSVRGYRQDALLTDSGAFVSAEVRLPIYRSRQRQTILQLTPFIDAGTTWNNGRRNRNGNTTDPNTLVSVGLGLRLQLSERFAARLDWGIPLIDLSTRKRTWQENGVYFSIVSSPF
ncbi:MAG: ShlB/FhaC/HecB family hemolysin secretion/activation protein [Gloeocapsa sp. UFS-A4-WI-NPMV-4B04]|nr:ShlB/FhaC/HecB family hemolysin secretion/activation protein [Gloeocapsa sp. UFS-A4-WI-NPMV-4B04]